MITLIGSSSTVIGFGLCGIERVIEIDENATVETVQEHVDAATTDIIMVSERFSAQLRTQRILIPIPDRHKDTPTDRLDELVRDVVGIKGD